MSLKSSYANSNTSTLFSLKQKKSSSGISRSVTIFQNLLPLNIRFKKLRVTYTSRAGRNQSGQKTLRTRGARPKKQTRVVINYSFRSRFLTFVAGFYLVPFYNKLISLVFLSSGSALHLVSTSKQELFSLTRLYRNSKYLNTHYLRLKNLSEHVLIRQGFFLIAQLTKNKPVSLLELLPEKGIQYIRSTGSRGTILKMDLRLHTGIIKLPSGVKKVFSTNAIGSEGSVALPQNKYKKNTKAGFKKVFGFKPTVRGVAMNPVDHPHGGRAKAIRYPRTP